MDGHMESGYYQIDSFRFLAFCLLGDDVEPCFEGSRLQLFEANKFQESITDFMEAIRNYNLNTSLSGSAIYENERKEEVEPMEKEKDFVEEPITEEPTVAEEQPVGSVAEPVTDPTVEPAGENFELTSNLMSQIHEELSAITVEMEWGPMCRYWYVDADFAAQMVYCFDVNDDHLYGMHYSLNGDIVSIDYDSCKRMKFAIVEFEEGTGSDPLHFVANIRKKYVDEMTWVRTDLQRVTNELTDTNALFVDLRAQNENLVEENKILAQFKKDTEIAQVQAQKEELFTKWEALIGETEQFTALKEDMESYTVDSLETELKCLFADTKANFALKNSESSKSEKKTTRIPVESSKTNTNTEDYGGLYSKYGVKPIRE